MTPFVWMVCVCVFFFFLCGFFLFRVIFWNAHYWLICLCTFLWALFIQFARFPSNCNVHWHSEITSLAGPTIYWNGSDGFKSMKNNEKQWHIRSVMMNVATCLRGMWDHLLILYSKFGHFKCFHTAWTHRNAHVILLHMLLTMYWTKNNKYQN